MLGSLMCIEFIRVNSMSACSFNEPIYDNRKIPCGALTVMFNGLIQSESSGYLKIGS